MTANSIRHFLDIDDVPPADLRAIIDASLATKTALKAGRPGTPASATGARTIPLRTC